MVIVRFNQWEEFLGELAVHRPGDQTVRLTFSVRFDRQGATHLTMVAGYLKDGDIVEFVHYLGVQPADRKSPPSREIQTLFEERRTHLEGLGLKVKSGRYHVPPSLQR
jgi:hypothetical protein